ncbi:MAG: TonB-dependent receptor [Deltaproteobacteria bacterium]|jgi:iron complex outermembrane receptor protein|nr:TonB-dependent receptor [Deltaproteobacteria bacterium]
MSAVDVLAQDNFDRDLNLEPVEVTAKHPEGSTVTGYIITESKSLGPWGTRELLDTPYTISAASEEYITNQQMQNPGDLINRLPGINSNGGASEHNLQNLVNARGFPTSANAGIRISGIPNGNPSTGQFLEEMESVEVMSGPTGFMFGSNNPGASINYNLKRASFENMGKFRLGSYGNKMAYAHIDVGGPIISDTLAVRLNLLHQKGEGHLVTQQKNRDLIALAVDWHITDNIKLETNISRGLIKLKGRQAGFIMDTTDNNAFADTSLDPKPASSMPRFRLTTLREPPDPKYLWASDDTFHNVATNTYLANLTAKINDLLTFRLGYVYNNVTRDMVWGNNYFTSDPDIFRAAINVVKFRFKNQGGHGYLDWSFNSGPFVHKLTTGFNFSIRDQFQKAAAAPGGIYYAGRFSVPSIANSFDLDQYNLMGILGDLTSNDRTSQIKSVNVIIGDAIRITDNWEIMVGVNHSTLVTNSYSRGAISSKYEDTALTPTMAVLFKPHPNITFYGSYIEALENGVTVPLGYENEGEVLSPLVSEQFEFGAKALIGRVFLTAALYQLSKPSNIVLNNYYTQDGNQRSRGLEFTFRGKLTEDFTILGGFNIMSAKITMTNDRLSLGKQAAHSPKFAGKLFMEYDVPFLEGLTLTGGINHFGKVYTSTRNETLVPAYTYGDLGFRYTYTKDDDTKLIFRLNCTNVTNKKYWYGGGNSHLQVGLPRTIAFSIDYEI